MDINEKLEQTSTFTGGMNTDTSDLYLQPSEYRLAKNLRLTTDTESNGGELHMIDGVTADVPFHDQFEEIYATTSIRNYGIIIGQKNREVGWGIYRFDNDNISEGLKTAFGPCTEQLDYNNKFSLVTRWESDNNIKLYIADGEHELMSCFIDDDHINKNYTEINSITVTKNTALSKLDIEVIDGDGYFNSPVIRYVYRIYESGGGVSAFSPISEPVVIYKENGTGYRKTDTIKKLINLTGVVTNINGCDKIQLYRISYVESGQLPEVSLIADYKFDGQISYQDNGISIETIDFTEFISLSRIKIHPALIESKNDYLFAGNIKYTQDEIDEKFKTYDFKNGHGIVTIEIIPQYYHVTVEGNVYYVSGDSSYGPSLKRGETYRYGIVLYDYYGNKSSVFYVDDITVPEYQKDDVENSGTYDYSYDNGVVVGDRSKDNSIKKQYYRLRKYGIKVKVNSIDGCYGYEIVRCARSVRDTKHLFLGIVGATYGNPSGGTRCSSCVLTKNYLPSFPQNDLTKHRLYRRGDVLMFACPEYAYLSDDIENILTSGNYKLKDTIEYTIPISNPTSITYRENNYNRYSIGVNYYNSIRHSDYNNTLFAYIHTGSTGNNSVEASRNKLHDCISGIDVDGFTTRQTDLTNTFIIPKDVVYNNERKQYDIIDVAFTKSPSPFGFADGDAITAQNDTYVVGNHTFLNWDAVVFISGTGVAILSEDSSNIKITNPNNKYEISSGGKYILINTDSFNLEEDFPEQHIGKISVCDICLDVIPYGGKTEAALKNSVYYSLGNFYLNDGTEKIIFDGDTYFNMFIFNSAHYFYSANYSPGVKNAVVYSVPIESSIDLAATYGDLYTRIGYDARILDEGPVKIESYTLSKPSYLYNTVYNNYISGFYNVSVDRTDTDIYNFDCRFLYSDIKTNGERIDSWGMFKSANFLDVDTRYGAITDLKLFKNTLMYWQKDATGVLSVNERTIIQDLNDTNIILGNGDVLLRYDYLTTKYGMAANDRSTTQSDSVLYWWDSLNREMLAYGGGQQVVPLSKTKNVSDYIKNNSNVTTPALLYDTKHNEILFNVVEGGPIVYSENVLKFTSVYEMPFEYSIPFSDKIYFIKNNKVFVRNNLNDIKSAKGTLKNELHPYLKYVVNNQSRYNKVFDTMSFGGRFEGGDDITDLWFTFKTPLKQESRFMNGYYTNEEYDFRASIPRAGKLDEDGKWVTSDYGDRMRGKTMQCEMGSTSNSTDFSLQYITTKFRISWS